MTRVLLNKGEREISPSAMREEREVVAVFKPESSHQNPAMPTPRSQAWGSQNLEEISFCHLSHSVYDFHAHYELVLTNLFISSFWP